MTGSHLKRDDGMEDIKRVRNVKDSISKPVPPRPVGMFSVRPVQLIHKFNPLTFTWVVNSRPDMRHGIISRYPRSPYAQSLYKEVMRKW